MAYQNTFKRRELKYLLDERQAANIRKLVEKRASPDEHGTSVVNSVYLDTPDWLLARRSLEKPPYKEKLRVRAYGAAHPAHAAGTAEEDTAFIEVKKKYRSTVYKRRIAVSRRDAEAFLAGDSSMLGSGPTDREIANFVDRYGTLRASVCLTCRREAFVPKDDSGFRITFDSDIRWRREGLSPFAPPSGERIVPKGSLLMELKCCGSMPLWMARFLSVEGIRRQSFSKYGSAYRAIRARERAAGVRRSESASVAAPARVLSQKGA